MMAARTRQSVRDIFRWPVVIGVLSTLGLLSALLGDGIWDGLSWVALGIPVLLYGIFAQRGR
jgi:hypothetical protein